MEFGLIPQIFEYTDKRLESVQKLKASKDTAPLAQENLLNESLEKGDSNNTSDVKASNPVKGSAFNDYNEVSITNINFGFNAQTGDFFVRAIRGDSETQFPTDEMMKLKAYLQELNQDEIIKVG